MQMCQLLCGPLSALMILSSVLASEGGWDVAQSICGAYAPGDVIIGILLPCHRKVKAIHERIRPETFQCSHFDPTSFIRSLAAIHEIEKINAAGFLPGVHLGYLMCDTCSYASKALQNVMHMLAVNGSLNVARNYTDFRPGVKIILGALYYEESIAVARLLNVYMVPLLSSTSSSPELSDKPRYPSFIRTVPSDIHQTKAVAKIMHHFQWNWVGVVYGDDDYGKAAFDSFLKDAGANNVCLAYQEVVPHYLDHVNNEQRIKQVAQQIRSSNAQVVLLILKAELVESLFKEMIRTRTTRTWIASDAWSRSGSLAQMDGINRVGDILGFTFVAGKSESFDNYLKNLSATPGGYNHFIEEYKNLRFNCSTKCFSSEPPSYCPSHDLLKIKSDNACDVKDPQEQNDDYLVTALDTSETFLHRVAVWATANALKKLLKCNSSSCSGDINLHHGRELKEVEFTYDNLNFHFDINGDSTNGYDLVRWEMFGQHRRFKKSGTYHVLNEQFEFDGEDFTWYSTGNITAPRSRCSEPCPGGSEKKILNVSCCYNCTQCVEGMYSDDPDLNNCKMCPSGTWSLKGWDHCQPRSESYLRWINPYPIAVTTAAALGILLLLVTLIIFLVYRDSPAIKKAELRLSCVMKAGLAASFVSVLCFMGKPSVHLCRARQVVYAMGFTLCVSCIVVKAYRTFLAFFPLDHIASRPLNKPYKPPVIVSVLTGVQGIICLLWMIFDSPDIDDTLPSLQSMEKIIQCTEGETYIGFGIMLSYIGLLVFVCFLLAFKGRRVPQENSETGYIIFSMLMYLFVWVCFIPVYITRNEEGTIVQASAILVSSYGIVFCHFFPKCY